MRYFLASLAMILFVVFFSFFSLPNDNVLHQDAFWACIALAAIGLYAVTYTERQK